MDGVDSLPWWLHQRRWRDDASRFRIAIKARQIGWSTILGAEALRDAVCGDLHVLASVSQRQSLELLRKVKAMVPIIEAAGLRATTNNSECVEFSNGGRVLCLPANPETIAGYTGHVTLDEFPRHKNSRAIWEALFPSISTQARYRVSVVGSPMGRRGQFYEMIEEARLGRTRFPWSLHQVDVHQAIANGCGHDLEELRAACFDEQVFRQSFLCEFVDESYALLPYELILQCVNDDLPYEPDLASLYKRGDLYLGMDIGRTRNLSVIAILERISRDVFVCAGVIEMPAWSFDDQEAMLYRVLSNRNLRKACIDETAIGKQLAERAARKFGAKVEGIHFTEAIKEELGGLTRRTFEQRNIFLPDRDILFDDLHSVERITTTAGHLRLQAPQEHGHHADRYTAISLALHAGTYPVTVMEKVRKLKPARQDTAVGGW